MRVLNGGLPAWRAAGLPLSDEPVAYPPAAFVARPRPELLASTADVEQIASGAAPACLVNALPPAQFRGERASGTRRPGRIPRSVNVPVHTLLDAETNRFLPRERLRDELAAAGLLGAAPVVAYCGGGIGATLDLFALALVGRDDARLYDGSLTEWAADAQRPIERD